MTVAGRFVADIATRAIGPHWSLHRPDKIEERAIDEKRHQHS
jgi:hypothetical protein